MGNSRSIQKIDREISMLSKKQIKLQKEIDALQNQKREIEKNMKGKRESTLFLENEAALVVVTSLYALKDQKSRNSERLILLQSEKNKIISLR